ncbi:MAG TPA: thioredoxin family protein [Candidatus Thermoplasmatota archaeon]|nr:thioredoxin family protein [Candidatus Thermoplasmatota archaeon]
MALTPSAMITLGTPCPNFALPDTDGRLVRRDDVRDAPALLVIFLCNHCPYVKHVANDLAQVAAKFQAKGVAVVGISSNDVVQYPEDAPDMMRREKRNRNYAFPYLFDETQLVARSFGATCTPDFFLYGKDRRLLYRGQFDDSRPGNGKPITGADLVAAVDAVLAGREVPVQKPSMGCNIKWK